MKTAKRIITIILVICIAASLSGCSSSKNDIKKLVNRFETACNEINADEMLNCLNPTISDTVRTAAGILSIFTSKSADDLISSIADVVLGNSLFGTNDFFKTLDIKMESITISEDGKSASGTATVTYTIDSTSYNKSATLKFVYKEDQWYISKFSIDL